MLPLRLYTLPIGSEMVSRAMRRDPHAFRLVDCGDCGRACWVLCDDLERIRRQRRRPHPVCLACDGAAMRGSERS